MVTAAEALALTSEKKFHIFIEKVLESFVNIKENSTDNVLMEWELALELYKHSRLHIVPILVGTNPDGMSKKFNGWRVPLPDVYTAHCKTRTVKETVQELMRIQGVFLDPEDPAPRLRDLLERFQTHIWPKYRTTWADQAAIGMEEEQLCAQCGEVYLESKNTKNACRYHVIWGRGDSNMRVGCCNRSSGDPGCKTSRHRPDNHNEYPYALHEVFWKTCIQWNQYSSWLPLQLSYPAGSDNYMVETQITVGCTEGSHNWTDRLFTYGWFGQAYHKVYDYDEVAKIGLGEEKVTSQWKIKVGTLEERIMGVGEGVWRLVVSWTPKDEETYPTIGAILFRWEGPEYAPEHTAAPIKAFEKVGLGSYTLPPITRSGTQLPFPKPRKPAPPKSWNEGLPIKLAFKSAEIKSDADMEQDNRITLSIEYPEGSRKIDVKSLNLTIYYRLRGFNTDDNHPNVFKDPNDPKDHLDPLQWHVLTGHTWQEYPKNERHPTTMTIGFSFPNLTNNFPIHFHNQDAISWRNLGGVTSRAGPLLFDVVLSNTSGKQAGVTFERCADLSAEFERRTQKPKDFIGQLSVDYSEIWRREYLWVEKGVGLSKATYKSTEERQIVVVVHAEQVCDKVFNYDVGVLRDAVKSAIKSQNPIVKLHGDTNTNYFSMDDGPRLEVDSTYQINAIVDIDRKVVYALQIGLSSDIGKARGYFRVPEYGDCLWNGKFEPITEEMAVKNFRRGMEVVPVSEVGALESFEEDGEELWVDQDETDFAVRVVEEAESDEYEEDGEEEEVKGVVQTVIDRPTGFAKPAIDINTPPESRGTSASQEKGSAVNGISGSPETPTNAPTPIVVNGEPPKPSAKIHSPSRTSTFGRPPAAAGLDTPTALIASLREELRTMIKGEKSAAAPPPPTFDVYAAIQSLRDELRTLANQQRATPPAFDMQMLVQTLRQEIRDMLREEESRTPQGSSFDTGAVVDILQEDLHTMIQQERLNSAQSSGTADTAIIIESLRADLQSIIINEMSSLQRPPSLTLDSIRSTIRTEVRPILNDEIAKLPQSRDIKSIIQKELVKIPQLAQQQAPIDPDVLRSLVRTEIRATVHDEMENFFDRLKIGKEVHSASLPRKPSVVTPTTMSPPASVVNRGRITPSPTSKKKSTTTLSANGPVSPTTASPSTPSTAHPAANTTPSPSPKSPTQLIPQPTDPKQPSSAWGWPQPGQLTPPASPSARPGYAFPSNPAPPAPPRDASTRRSEYQPLMNFNAYAAAANYPPPAENGGGEQQQQHQQAYGAAYQSHYAMTTNPASPPPQQPYANGNPYPPTIYHPAPPPSSQPHNAQFAPPTHHEYQAQQPPQQQSAPATSEGISQGGMVAAAAAASAWGGRMMQRRKSDASGVLANMKGLVGKLGTARPADQNAV
ncbi:hypothetical protein HDV00_006515 [Rhizophlyctis rosea]|nr:hypothetical protein HDV00_006515 [Rhizophlyctis rosea]